MKLARTELGQSKIENQKSKMSRSGFTLVEMIVVIGIMVVLMALAVAVIPRVQERSKAARGADQLQGWLLIAKQTALRDRFPRGIRLNAIVDTDANIVHAHQLQYIEQPPDLSSQTFGAIQLPLMPPTPPASGTLTVQFLKAGVDLTYGYFPNNQ